MDEGDRIWGTLQLSWAFKTQTLTDPWEPGYKKTEEVDSLASYREPSSGKSVLQSQE